MRIFGWIRNIFSRRHSEPTRPTTPAQTQPTTPLPSTPATDAHQGQDGFDGPLKVNLQKRSGMTVAESQKLDRAAALLQKVVNSPEFEQKVLAYRGWNGGYADNEGMTNAQVLAKIRAASETLTPGADGEIDIDVEVKTLGWRNRNTVGYTYESTTTITSNRKFFSNYTPSEVAGNLGHEWLHKLGFEHDFNSTSKRPHSVPYAIGNIIEELATKFARQELAPAA